MFINSTSSLFVVFFIEILKSTILKHAFHGLILNISTCFEESTIINEIFNRICRLVSFSTAYLLKTLATYVWSILQLKWCNYGKWAIVPPLSAVQQGPNAWVAMRLGIGITPHNNNNNINNNNVFFLYFLLSEYDVFMLETIWLKPFWVQTISNILKVELS